MAKRRLVLGCLLLVTLLLVLAVVPANAFSASQMKARRFGSDRGRLGYSFYDHEGDSPAERQLRARTCVRNLLTQRAIQSFMFLLLSCRDPHTVQWLQSNLKVNNLEHFHGTGAFNTTLFPTWDSMLLEILSKPKDSVTVTRKTRRGGGGSGWRGQVGGWNEPPKRKRKENPHLQERVVKIHIDIDPVSLVSRIVSVREQIAAECQTDFDTMIYANDQILESYFEVQESSRIEGDTAAAEGQDNNTREEDEEEEDHSSFTLPYSDASKRATNDNPKQNAFDRYNAMLMLANSIDGNERNSSPLRKGNFDLMLLLTTQESIHRVLKEYAQAGDERDVSFAWLRDFYMDRVQEFFDGHQRYGRADDFLEELLLTPPMLKNLDNDHRRKVAVGLIDPLRMAEDIIRKRSEVGREWKQIIADVPHEHMELRRELLARQMMMAEQQDIDIFISPATESAMELNEGFE